MEENGGMNNGEVAQSTQQSNIDLYLSGLLDADPWETMPSPPPSSEMVFGTGHGGPADEIPLLVAEARRITQLTPALATVMTTHKQLILSVFDCQIQLIKSRSQALEDGHVTVYDKALLALARNGHDLENPAALLFWCENYLGFDNVRGPTDTARIMQETMAVRTVLDQGKRGPRLCHSHVTDLAAVATASDFHRLSGTTMQAEPDDSPEAVVFGKQATDPRLKRLWTVYEKAHEEYLAVADKDGQATITAAKFLRDTAENALAVLKDKKIDATALHELERTCNTAKNTVVALSGGKKRKFDEEEMKKSATSGGYVARGGSRGGGGGRARGHSGIPYGYTRPVDSYHPY